MTSLNGKLRSLPVGIILVLTVAGCQHSSAPKADRPATTPLSDEVSLKADRSQYDELRKEIPEEVRRENDELAFVQQMLTQGEAEPAKIREKFSKAVRDRREKYDKTARQRRDHFNAKEKNDRDEFLKAAKKERDDFMRKNKKTRAEKRKEFFDDQESKRQAFFAGQRDTRREFEAQETEARRTFEAYMTEKTNKFNSEMREYTTAFYDRRKNLELKKQAEAKAKKSEAKKALSAPGPAQDEVAQPAGPDPDLEQFKQIPKTPATPLASPGEQ